MKRNSKRSLLLLAVMPVLLLIQLGLGLGIYQKIKRTEAIATNNSKLDLYLKNNTKYVSFSESAIRGYLLTEDSKYYESYKTYLEEWKKNEAYYDSLPPEVKRPEVHEIQIISRQKLAVTAQTIQFYNYHAKDSALDMVKNIHGQSLMDSVRSKSNFLRNRLSEEFTDERNGENRLLFAFFMVIAALLILSLFFAWYTYRAFNLYTKSLEESVSALEDTNEKMLQLNTEFKAANNYLEQLAYISAHDLKSPIHSLNGLVDMLLLSKNTDPKDAEIIRLQKKVILQMQRTNNGLNDILKLREGLLSKENINRSPMALTLIIEAVQTTLQPEMEKAGATLRINLNDVGNVQFPFLYMQSVLHNLIGNALKFKDPARNLIIDFEAKKMGDSTFAFVIADNGRGFDAERNKAKLFGIFKRFHPDVEGTGIGLHMVKSIIDAFDGEIKVTSEVGKGTKFEIIFKNPI